MIRFSEVLGNSQMLDGGSMFGNVPKAMWNKWAPADELNRIELACRALLIEIDEQKILFEAGIGAFFEPKMADRFGVQNYDQHQLLENLQAMDIAPTEIDWVILSHLHFDHAGGVLPTYQEIQEGKDQLVFPNAKYIVSEEAFSRAEHPHFRDRASFIPKLTDKLRKTKKLHLIKEGQASPISPEHIEFVFSHGHTPGQMHALVSGKSTKIFFAGDLVPGTAWVHLPVTMGYDRYAEQVIDEKQKLFERALAEGWELFYTHDPKVACSKIDQNDKGKYIPINKLANPKKLPF